jgi:phosphatidylglycerol:prolipoprotein diacylglycerol transferase
VDEAQRQPQGQVIETPIVHHSFVFALGPLKLTGFGIAMMAAFAVAHFVAQTVLRKRGDDDDIMNDVTFAALVGTIVGGNGLLRDQRDDRRSSIQRRPVQPRGFVYWGGFIGSVLLSWLVIRWRKQSFLRVATVRRRHRGGLRDRAHRMLGGRRRLRRPWNGPLAVAFPEGRRSRTWPT